MSAWLQDRQRDPVRFPHIPFKLAWAVAWQRHRVQFALERMRQGFPNDFRFAWRDYRGLMAKVGEINRNLKARREA